MLATIFTAIGGIKTLIYGLAGVALISGALYIVHVIKQDGAMRVQLDQALQVNRANVEAFNEYKLDQAAAEKAVADQHQADLARLASASKLKQEIAHAPASDNGPVAAVLARTLDGLRNRPAANPAAN